MASSSRIALLEVVEWSQLSPEMSALLLFITLFSVVIAKAYSHIIGVEFARRGPMNWRERGHIFVGMLPVLYSGAVPLTMVIAAWVGLLPAWVAIPVAQFVLVGVMFVLSFLSRRWSGGSLRHSIMVGLVAAALGLFAAEFKVFVDTLKK